MTEQTIAEAVVDCPHCEGSGQLVRVQREYLTRRPRSNLYGGYRGQLEDFEGYNLTPAMIQTIKLVRSGVHTRAGVAAARGVSDASAGNMLRRLIADNWLWSPASGLYYAMPGEGPQLGEVATDARM